MSAVLLVAVSPDLVRRTFGMHCLATLSGSAPLKAYQQASLTNDVRTSLVPPPLQLFDRRHSDDFSNQGRWRPQPRMNSQPPVMLHKRHNPIPPLWVALALRRLARRCEFRAVACLIPLVCRGYQLQSVERDQVSFHLSVNFHSSQRRPRNAI